MQVLFPHTMNETARKTRLLLDIHISDVKDEQTRRDKILHAHNKSSNQIKSSHPFPSVNVSKLRPSNLAAIAYPFDLCNL